MILLLFHHHYVINIFVRIIIQLNDKIRERKVKTLTRNWRDHYRTGTRKHTETVLKYFDRHVRLSQSEESKCLWTHDKYGVKIFRYSFRVLCCINRFTSLCKNLFNLLEFLAEHFIVQDQDGQNNKIPCVFMCLSYSDIFNFW